jgi:hypothetical protein
MGYLYLALLILAGVIALSGFIVAKKPDARAVLDKLVPFQAFIGVALLVLSVVSLLLYGIDALKVMKLAPMAGAVWLSAIASGVVLGALFGMPQIVKWIPGESSAEHKAIELSQKAAPYQALFGVLALGSGVALLLLQLGILKPY